MTAVLPRVVPEPAGQDLLNSLRETHGIRAATAQATAFLRDALGTA